VDDGNNAFFQGVIAITPKIKFVESSYVTHGVIAITPKIKFVEYSYVTHTNFAPIVTPSHQVLPKTLKKIRFVPLFGSNYALKQQSTCEEQP
jgi:hypothetical protein